MMINEIYSFPDLLSATGRFTPNTSGRLVRTLVRALRGSAPVFRAALHHVVCDGSRELRAQGMDDQAVLAFFAFLVADAGRACGADRPSLMSGELRWVSVQNRVLEYVKCGLGVPTLSPVCAMCVREQAS